MQFLQPTHSEVYANAVPTHKLSGSEQLNPFGRSLRGAVATKKHTNQSKQARKTNWTKPRDCLRLLLCSFLGFEPKATIQLDCNNCLNVQDPKIFLKKTLFNSPEIVNIDTAVADAPSDDRQPIFVISL